MKEKQLFEDVRERETKNYCYRYYPKKASWILSNENWYCVQ
jgi:hypothetical protein